VNRIILGIDIIIQHSAVGGVPGDVSRPAREVNVIDLSEQEVRDGGEEADGPAEDGDDEDPGEVRGGEGEEGGADDEVSLQGEGEDRQD